MFPCCGTGGGASEGGSSRGVCGGGGGASGVLGRSRSTGGRGFEYDTILSMCAFDGCAQSSGWKFTFTGDLGAWPSFGDPGAGAEGKGLPLCCDQPWLSVLRLSNFGTGLRRMGLVFADDGAEGGGEVVTAAIAALGYRTFVPFNCCSSRLG